MNVSTDRVKAAGTLLHEVYRRSLISRGALLEILNEWERQQARGDATAAGVARRTFDEAAGYYDEIGWVSIERVSEAACVFRDGVKLGLVPRR